jgi:N-hydroxyarylamine O-acetyltransferase
VARHFSHDEVAHYVRRIGVTDEPTLDAGWLDTVQRNHLRHVPFEALDICPLQRPLSLETKVLYEKIVGQRRGGYCFELNGLLAAMLEDIGYAVARHEARFVSASAEGRAVYDHLVLTVSVPGSDRAWLVDVGAGSDSPDEIVPIDGVTENGRYRTAFDGQHWRLARATADGTMRESIEWRPQPVPLESFAGRSRALETDRESYFRQAPICTIVREDGRDTISRWTLIETRGTNRTETPIADLAEMRRLLRERFGIELELDRWWEGEPG